MNEEMKDLHGNIFRLHKPSDTVRPFRITDYFLIYLAVSEKLRIKTFGNHLDFHLQEVVSQTNNNNNILFI